MVMIINPSDIKKATMYDLGLKLSFNELSDYIKDIKIYLTEKEIKSFLENKMNNDYPGLKEKLENENNYPLNHLSYIKKIQNQN